MGLRNLRERDGERAGSAITQRQTAHTIEFQDNRGTNACTSYFFRVRGTITGAPPQGASHKPDIVVGDDADKDAAVGVVANGGSDVWEFEGELLQVETEVEVPPTVLLDGGAIDPGNFNDVGTDSTDEPTTAPPESLQVVVDQNVVTLSWAPPSGVDVDHYNVYADGTQVLQPVETSAELSNLAAGQHTFDVTTVNTAGDESAAATVTATVGEGDGTTAQGGLPWELMALGALVGGLALGRVSKRDKKR